MTSPISDPGGFDPINSAGAHNPKFFLNDGSSSAPTASSFSDLGTNLNNYATNVQNTLADSAAKTATNLISELNSSGQEADNAEVLQNIVTSPKNAFTVLQQAETNVGISTSLNPKPSQAQVLQLAIEFNKLIHYNPMWASSSCSQSVATATSTLTVSTAPPNVYSALQLAFVCPPSIFSDTTPAFATTTAIDGVNNPLGQSGQTIFENAQKQSPSDFCSDAANSPLFSFASTFFNSTFGINANVASSGAVGTSPSAAAVAMTPFQLNIYKTEQATVQDSTAGSQSDAGQIAAFAKTLTPTYLASLSSNQLQALQKVQFALEGTQDNSTTLEQIMDSITAFQELPEEF